MIIKIEIKDKRIRVGDNLSEPTVGESPCNQTFKDRYWCPKAKWLMKEACPFESLHECESYEEMCGGF